MKLNSIFTKTVAVAALSIVGVTAVNTMNNNEAQAGIVQNDATTYRVYVSTTVYNSYQNGVATGQVLAPNTNWKVIKTAYDAQGNKWYDLGKNQWVKVITTSAKTTVANKQNQTSYNNSNTYNYTNNNTYSYNTNKSSSSVGSYTSNATGSEASAKAWIANRESGGSYSARNGQYIGKYQLSASYLGGNYSAANQERVANNYVKSRYGSWTAAKSFWQSHGWY